jgi:hypothetical protein
VYWLLECNKVPSWIENPEYVTNWCPYTSLTRVGSMSQWNFIALKVQYTAVNYSQQLFSNSNTRTTSTGSLIQLPQITIGSAPNTTSELFKLSRTTAQFIWNLSLIYHTAVSIVMFPFKLLCYFNKSIVMQQDCYVTMEMKLVCRSCYQGNLICNNIDCPEVAHCLHDSNDDEGSTNLWHVSLLLRDYMAL